MEFLAKEALLSLSKVVVSIGTVLVLVHAFLYNGVCFHLTIAPLQSKSPSSSARLQKCVFLCRSYAKIIHFSLSNFCKGVRGALKFSLHLKHIIPLSPTQFFTHLSFASANEHLNSISFGSF